MAEKRPEHVEDYVQPQYDLILVKVDADKEERTQGGIIIPVTVNANKKTQTGRITAVGTGRRDPRDSSKFIPIDCKVGDYVLMATYIGYPFSYNDEEYVLVKNTDIMAFLNRG